MGTQGIRQPTLFFRTAHFIDRLCAMTGLGFGELEERIRVNQYERFGLSAPDWETVRDYFRLHRSVAFEPRLGRKGYSPGDRKERSSPRDRKGPWLMAAEMEFPGSSFAFFHPLFDLLFGRLESMVFWAAHFSRIPEVWIDREESAGRPEIAREWRAINRAREERAHRAKPVDSLDPLSFIHLTLMRLPLPIEASLFERKGLATTWARRYRFIQEEVNCLGSMSGLDALAGLLGLSLEAAEIGDMTRFATAKAATIGYLGKLKEAPGCARIYREIKTCVEGHFENEVFPRRYSRTLNFGFGLPASWRAQLTPPLIARTLECMALDPGVEHESAP